MGDGSPDGTPKPRRVGVWLATAAAVVGLATGVLTLRDQLFPDDDPPPTPTTATPTPPQAEIPRYDGVAGHLEDSRALLDFLDQNDHETVYLDIGFPDIGFGPAVDDNVFTETVPYKGGTKIVIKSVELMTECKPGAPTKEENPTVFDGCQGSSLSIHGSENDDSGTFFEHGVPRIKGYFAVDVTGGLHMGISPILLRPLTFEQAKGT